MSTWGEGLRLVINTAWRLSAALLLVGVCQAQISLSLREALAAAANNPAAAIGRLRIEQAQAMRTQAGLSPNPRLYLQSEDARPWGNAPFSFWNATEDYAYLGQVFETGGKRGRRVDVAASDLASSRLENELVRRQIEARIVAAYWAAAGAEQVRDLYRRYLQTYQEDERYIENRVKEGVAAEVDAMRIRIEVGRVRVQADYASRDFETALVELYRAMGRNDFPATNLTDALDANPPSTMPDLAGALRSRIEARAAQNAIGRAQANLKLQHADAKPDPEALAGYKRDVGYDTLYGAVQIDLPVRNRNQGNIAAANAEVRVAQENLTLAEANIRADFTAAQRAYQIEQSTAGGLPAIRATADETVRLARAAYREGGIDLLRLLDAERARIDFEIQYWQSLVELKQGFLSLQMAAGSEITP